METFIQMIIKVLSIFNVPKLLNGWELLGQVLLFDVDFLDSH